MTITEEKQQSSVLPMAIVAVLFFILGFATWLNGSLMPYLKQILQLSPFQASLIIFSFYIAVTFTALPSAWLIRKVGYKNGMALGMGVMMVPDYYLFLLLKPKFSLCFYWHSWLWGRGKHYYKPQLILMLYVLAQKNQPQHVLVLWVFLIKVLVL
ncbi:MFS transporter [Colwellia maritima]|uniref:MFS transporter n=1 Tax=Colwellia maritima TaxID=2912588 RepID=UPI0030843C16